MPLFFFQVTSEAVGAPNTSSGGQTVSFQRTVSGQLVPVTVRQTKITEHGVASQLPPHLLQQMYAGKCHLSSWRRWLAFMALIVPSRIV